MKSKLFLFSLFTTALVQAQSWKAVEGRIMSQWAKEVNPENVWQEYPRPQFERAQWKNINGLWDPLVLNRLCRAWEKISVPRIKCGIKRVLRFPKTGRKKM
jgi:hypothetical protein